MQQPGFTVRLHVHAVAPVKGIARRLACRDTFYVTRRAFIAILPYAADMPDALLLLAVIVDKMFIQGQRIADNIPGDLDVKTTDLLSPILYVIPFQVLSALICEDTGIDTKVSPVKKRYVSSHYPSLRHGNVEETK